MPSPGEHLSSCLDSLRADAIFAWRQFAKKKLASAAAMVSLALAIGACTSAFRLIDALLLRPLPIAQPNTLFAIRLQGIDEGKLDTWDSCSYPLFQRLRTSVKDQAELIAVSFAEHADLTYASDQEMEKAWRQYVSGWMFGSFGLHPAAGRLFTEDDDRKPGAHPFAVISYDYWTRRFARAPNAVGRAFRTGGDVYQIVGVAPEGFTGTEPGIMTDVFVPTMMNAKSVDMANAFWLRTFVRIRPDTAIAPLRDRLYAIYRAFEKERAKGFTNFPKELLADYPKEKLLVEPAAAGLSGLQRDYRRSLISFGLLVALVLLIACANVASLLIAQAAARAREMALRVCIGAGRWRLVRLVLVESALLACCAAVAGAFFAWWSAPFIVARINPPDNPARLNLPADWRVLAFSIALTLAVALLFGLAPALRASAVKPALALKGGAVRYRHRLMHFLVAAQVAFCFLVLFASWLFVTTFDRLSNQPTGFSTARLLTLDTIAETAQPPAVWDEMADRLRAVPGVEQVALAGWPLLSGTISNNFISINGAPPSDVLAYFLSISPGWMGTMKIPFAAGRDFRPTDAYPGVAIVNRKFARQFFGGQNPVGRSFETRGTHNVRTRFEIKGVVEDARYRNMRDPILPVVFVPIHTARQATLLVRALGPNPLAIAQALRREVPRARPEFRVANLRTQAEIVAQHTVRERLLAILAVFFASVAVLLAAVGLYGVLDYTVLQRTREIGIRMAVGARTANIAMLVATDVFSITAGGSLAGLALGFFSARYIESLLFDVRATDPGTIAVPALTILATAALAALPAIIRAVCIDPVAMLRAE